MIVYIDDLIATCYCYTQRRQSGHQNNDINSILFDDDSDDDASISNSNSSSDSFHDTYSSSSTNTPNQKRRSNSNNSNKQQQQEDSYDSERGLDYRKQYPLFVKGALTLRTHAQVHLWLLMTLHIHTLVLHVTVPESTRLLHTHSLWQHLALYMISIHVCNNICMATKLYVCLQHTLSTPTTSF
jgi:hypothetical protein